MPTIAELKSNHDAIIRQSVGANSISTDEVADQLDALADKIAETIDTEIVLPDAPVVVWNRGNGNVAKVTLGGNRTLIISNLVAPSFGVLKITQDGTGNRTLTLPGNVPAGWALSIGAGETDIIRFYYDGATFWWGKDNYGTVGNPLAATAWRTIYANDVVVGTDEVIYADATSQNIVLSVVPTVPKRPITVKKIDQTANTVTITPVSGSIDGDPFRLIGMPFESLKFHSNQTNLFLI